MYDRRHGRTIQVSAQLEYVVLVVRVELVLAPALGLHNEVVQRKPYLAQSSEDPQLHMFQM